MSKENRRWLILYRTRQGGGSGDPRVQEHLAEIETTHPVAWVSEKNTTDKRYQYNLIEWELLS